MAELTQAKALEKFAQTLTVVTFVIMCWVAHRSLTVRTQCIGSSFISFVQIGADRIENCRYESRLSLNRLFHPLSDDKVEMLRALEVLEPLAEALPLSQPRLAVDVSLEAPHGFELGHGFVRIGREWLSDTVQVRRALIMGVLKRQFPSTYANVFQLEVVADFLVSTVFGESLWSGHSLLAESRFPTSAPGFDEYCKSPFRSLAHFDQCARMEPDSADPQHTLWGFRPLLGVALARVFDKVSIRSKLAVMQAIREGRTLAPVAPLLDTSAEARVMWLQKSVSEQSIALGLKPNEETDQAIKRTLKELDVSSPTHWELTVDLTNTPAWRDVLEQFRAWSKLRAKERMLVFTPEGAIAFPSGLPVEWAAEEVQSQKHVMIACHWPKAEEAIPVTARHIYARQTCGKLDEVFWN